MSDAPAKRYWLFSAPVDLSVFLGSAVLALGLLVLGGALGILHSDSPSWTWVAVILLIDVAHVWSTIFRVYLDSDVFRERRFLYIAAPLGCFATGVVLYSIDAMLFWRVLAYMAVFHFVRQQYGWVRLYRGRLGESDRFGHWFDGIVIYAATVFPLLWWHAHLPREFWWFLVGDFRQLPTIVAQIAEPIYWALMAAYVVRAGYQWLGRGHVNPGKHIVVVTTAVCWYVGIIAYNSDYAFTVTNVVIHGIPYFALIYWYGRGRYRAGKGGAAMRAFRYGPWLMFLVIWVLAFCEELLWDKGVWHERSWLFGSGLDASSWRVWLVPLLATPQATHYVLDGFIWRRGSNPELAVLSASAKPTVRSAPGKGQAASPDRSA